MPEAWSPVLTRPDVSEQEEVRLAKRAALLADGIEPYPVSVPRTHTLAGVRAAWSHLQTGEETDDVVSVTGRVVFVRNTGKLCFATLQEGLGPPDGTSAASRRDQAESVAGEDQPGDPGQTGEPGVPGEPDPAPRLQVMLSLAEIGADGLADWKQVVDLGDFVSVTGRVICSKRGELSVMATSWVLASKALRPLPTLHNELSDEMRVRRRYEDLTVRPDARRMVRTRAAVTRSVRETLHRLGYTEIETPVLQLVHGGANARPFNTHLNAFDIDMTLRIALELFLKRAAVGGIEQVYELGRIFRNEGIDSTHSAEFTMLEVYQAWGDQRTIADVVQTIVLDVADTLGSRTIRTEAGEIDLNGEWPWLGVYPGLSAALGEEITLDTPAERLRAIAKARDIALEPAWGADKIVLELFGEIVEPTLIQPTFVCDYPAIAQPLARQHRSEPGLIEAWDLMIGGVERGTGFSELVDPVIQRERLTAQSLAAAAGDTEAMQLDEDFLNALEFGAPPMGGLGLGIDRLVMLFTQAGIRETILFPLLRPGS